MKLSALAGEIIAPDPEISGLTADSRAVGSGYLFAALPGEKTDGVKFIPQAETKGAAAILAQPGVETRLPLVADVNPRARLAQMAARFFPRQPELIAGITGTNGKTSTANFAAQLWSLLGRKGGSFGTLGALATGFNVQTGFTTPEPVKLHGTLDAMAQAGVDRLAMEVSSHALSQARADGVRFGVAAFTNITQDHLDFHSDFEDYFAAKARLFSDLLPDDGIVVVNADGEGADRIISAAQARELKVMTTGAAAGGVKLNSATPTPTGIDLSVTVDNAEYRIDLPLIGLFQAENALLSAGIVIAAGEPSSSVLPLLENLQGVPGRMQHAADINGGGVFVDYAHTPDAVATALKAIRPHATGKVIAIIGAGGDRDRAKRPLMGKAAAENADIVIVTDDNPRTEDPSRIRQDIISACDGAENIGDRGDAIAKGVAMIESGDVLLIMGKGHETGQQVGAELLPFSDLDAARAAAARRAKRLRENRYE